jgi:hypothetical protein
LLAAGPALAAAPEDVPPGLQQAVPANRTLMERVLAESRVERTPVPPETSYLGELNRAFQRAVVGAILRGGRMLGLPRPVLQALAVALAVLAALLLLRLLAPRLRRRRSGEGTGEVAVLGPSPAARDAAAWRAELERCLAAGRIAEALEALWWWLARSLAGSQAEPDWTSRELVVRSRREDLRDLVRRLDVFTYGPRRPGIGELRDLTDRLEEALS